MSREEVWQRMVRDEIGRTNALMVECARLRQENEELRRGYREAKARADGVHWMYVDLLELARDMRDVIAGESDLTLEEMGPRMRSLGVA